MRTAAIALGLLLAGAPALAGAETAVYEQSDEGKGTEHLLTVQLQGGIEGYTGPLAPRIDPGAAWGLSLSIEPVPFLGVEFGYTGAENELTPGPSGNTDPSPGGPDLFRHGVYFIVTPGYTVRFPNTTGSTFKPYALGGLGLDRYLMRGNTGHLGYSNRTVPNVPFGAGIKARVGHLSADARVAAAWEFDERFSVFDAHPLRVQGIVLLGAAF